MHDQLRPESRGWARRRSWGVVADYVGLAALVFGLTACGATPSDSPTAEAPASAKPAASSSAPSTSAGFQVDPYWPKPLPEDWLLGNVVGVATDSADNVWIIHRPGSQAGAAETPPVIAFDATGSVVQSWGGPGDGYDWGTQTHGIHVDHDDNVWVGFGGG
ncbi:uncharacterized protein METZ01_LOCUS478692, partial [marine metagenome]